MAELVCLMDLKNSLLLSPSFLITIVLPMDLIYTRAKYDKRELSSMRTKGE